MAWQFSNHTGYKYFKGHKVAGTDVALLFDGLSHNQLMRYSHLLTGYMGSVAFLEAVIAHLDLILQHSPAIQFVCDPVMGDEGSLYVPAEFVALYRDRLVPRCHLVTPNQTEAQLLTGLAIACLADARRACELLHDMGPRQVVITSFNVSADQLGVPGIAVADGAAPPLLVVCSARAGDGGASGAGNQDVQHVFVVPKLPFFFSGTGDLTAALLLAFGHGAVGADGGADRAPVPLHVALYQALVALHAVLCKTFAAGSPELLLIQSQRELVAPLECAAAVAAVRGWRVAADGSLLPLVLPM